MRASSTVKWNPRVAPPTLKKRRTTKFICMFIF